MVSLTRRRRGVVDARSGGADGRRREERDGDRSTEAKPDACPGADRHGALEDAFRTEFPRSVSKNATLDLDPYRTQIASDLETPLRILLGAIGFVLLIACAN